jgi:uncharacterized protein (TIGR00255 family)
MSGFASLTHEADCATIAVTVRAVNHRFLDLQLRLPQMAPDAEARLRSLLQRRVARGRIELTLSVQTPHTASPMVELNLDLARALASAIERARAEGLVVGELAPGDLLRLPQAVTVRDAAQPDPALDARIASSMEAALERALGDLDAMRRREGAQLAADLDRRLEALARVIEQLREAADLGREALEQRLTARLEDVGLDASIDQAAVAHEIVRVAARSDISEEVTRFRAHLAHWRALADGGEPCGRKLDFLLQEMNREVNTIGSKADGLAVSELIIRAKAELERMREQVQNVE